MRITEIFFSIQGESSRAGMPCAFVRLTGCSLRCVWCDTKYAYFGGNEMSLDEAVAAVAAYPTRLVEITGGEPLEHEEVYALMNTLLAQEYTVMLETGGHVDVGRVPRAVIKIIDVKCPDSGEAHSFCRANLDRVESHDEFKFVIASRKDYEWARDFHRTHLEKLPNITLFSPVHGLLPLLDLGRWVLEDGLAVRVQMQLHKYIWGPDARGV